ncbi:MAG: DUF2269 family protein [Alphaproteobacteria bacterium]
MPKFVKAVHLLGVVMFFGSILGHITVGLVPGAKDDPQTALIVREAIAVATAYLTLPGLTVVLFSGIFMIVKGKLPILKIRWLTLHALFGLLIALNAAFMLYPTGRELLQTASQVVAGALPMERLHAIEAREAAFGAANLLLCLLMVFIAVIKPRFGTAKP